MLGNLRIAPSATLLAAFFCNDARAGTPGMTSGATVTAMFARDLGTNLHRSLS